MGCTNALYYFGYVFKPQPQTIAHLPPIPVIGKSLLFAYKAIPPDEKFSLTQQLGRASLSVFLNLSEGCSRKSLAERKRFFEISRSSLVEVDEAFEIASDLGYTSKEQLTDLGNTVVKCFKILSKMIDG